MRLVVALGLLLGLPWLAFAQRLGEPSLSWYTIHTEHFRVTFPRGLEGLAQEAAVAAEDAYQYLLTQLGYAPPEKIDLVLCDAMDTAHRELDVFQNRITVCVAQGDLAERFNPKFPSWVQQSVFSEYAQFVSADLVFGFSEVLRPLLGKLILPNFKSSELLEGIGEYIAQEALSTPPDVRPGIGGEHRFVRYLAERFGSDFLKEWHRLRANDPWATLSLGLWSNDERIFRRLTSSPSPLPLSPLRERGERGERGQREAESSTLIIQRDIHKHSYLYGDLYLYDPKTKREMRLTEGARVSHAALFPDGQKVLVARHRWGDQGPILGIFDIQARQMQTLKEFPMHDYFIDSFAISPDGEQIALSIWRRGGFQDIYLLELFPSPLSSPLPPRGEGMGVRVQLKPITRDRAVDLSPAFSPDGHFVLFLSDRDGSLKPYAYRLADGAFFAVDLSPDPSPVRGGEPPFPLGKGLGLGPQIQIEPEPFPPWDGFPDTEYLITPYDPRPSLEPKILIPLPGASSLSLLTFGSDALEQHSYTVLLGFDWRTLQPSYLVRYTNRVLLASLEALIERAGVRAQQSVTATLPLITKLSTRQGLSLFYRRDEEELITHQIGLGWTGSWRIFQNELELSLWGVTRTRTGQRLWENSVGWRVGVTAELSEKLRARLFVQQDGQLGIELEAPPLLRFGMLWNPTQRNIEFSLR
ncbi:MAG: hypothetical protein K6T71_05705 [Candidatus Bipolaricaulota bacterium]|nr:hypothetical protein [Candidatus Bipolaricaulota bacterium]